MIRKCEEKRREVKKKKEQKKRKSQNHCYNSTHFESETV